MKRIVVFLTMIGVLGQYISGQISEGGTPISFSLGIDTQKEKTMALVMPAVNAKALFEEDGKARMEDAERPFRFGYAIDVDIDLKKVGTKKVLPGGDKLWLLKIHCPDAFSINLIYDRFRLGKGSKLFIYNEDKTMVLGAFTPEVSNNPFDEFATDLIQGNAIILEYYEPESSDDGVIHINKVIHGYVNTFFSNGLGTSADCNTDVMCRLFGNTWVNEERAVTMLLVNNNTAFCTGCLVNNTQQDFTPYILTARHCYFNQNLNTQTTFPATNIFRFQYWRPNCGTGNPITTRSIIGATLLAHHAPTDFALLRLNTRPPTDWNVYYAGWDRTVTPAQTATGIHHPKGDAMKINHEQHPVIARTQTGMSLWRVQHFEQGTVQPGSSGSPLFNQNRRIVGQLSGRHPNPCISNNNVCDCNNPIGDYGRFDLSWTGGGTNSTRLSNWLAPGVSNPTQILDGISEPFITGPSLICYGTSYTFSATNAPEGFTWDKSPNFTLTGTGNSVSVSTTIGGSGWVSIKLGTVELSRRYILTGPPVFDYIDGPDEVAAGSSSYSWQAHFDNYNTISYSWSVAGAPQSWHICHGYSWSSIEICFLQPAYYLLQVIGENACGTDSGTKEINVTGSYTYYSISSAYPNPASNILNIEIDAAAITQTKSLQPTTTGTKQLKIDPTYDIRLYDGQGNLLRNAKTKGGTVQFNVASLTNGIYYLHIYDGTGDKPEMRQIVVEH